MCSFTGIFCHRWRVPDAPVLGQDICRVVNLVAVTDSCGIWLDSPVIVLADLSIAVWWYWGLGLRQESAAKRRLLPRGCSDASRGENHLCAPQCRWAPIGWAHAAHEWCRRAQNAPCGRGADVALAVTCCGWAGLTISTLPRAHAADANYQLLQEPDAGYSPIIGLTLIFQPACDDLVFGGLVGGDCALMGVGSCWVIA